MSSIKYTHDGGEYVIKRIDTGNQVAEVTGHIPYRHLVVDADDGELINNGDDSETITVSVVDGLEITRGADPSEASVLDHEGDVAIAVDGSKTTKTLENGSVEFDLTTEKSAGSEITVEAIGLEDNPAESDSTVIEVVSG